VACDARRALPLLPCLGAREAWTPAPGQSFALRLICPGCGGDFDVAEIDHRLAGNRVLLTVRRYRGRQLLGVHFMFEFNMMTGERRYGRARSRRSPTPTSRCWRRLARPVWRRATRCWRAG
jgi:hypothetical protein